MGRWSSAQSNSFQLKCNLSVDPVTLLEVVSMVKLLYKSYSSSGLCPETYYKYGQVVAILSLLLSTSTLLLLLITLVDVGKGDEQQSAMVISSNHHMENQMM